MTFRTAFLSLLFALGSCTSAPTEPPEFDGNRAYEYLKKQVSFGPRMPGTEAWRQCRSYYYHFFDSLGLAVDSQSFHFYDPYSRADVPLVNVIARHRSGDEDAPPILLGAHWDSRPRTDFHSDSTRIDEPIDGANDGASGVAVLMELAALVAQQAPGVNIDLVLFDGEDWGKPRDIDYYLLGSKHFARQGIRGKYKFGIVVDMIGDADQQIYREMYSEQFYKPLNDMIWREAVALGRTTFIDMTKYRVIDDHLPLSTAGVPTVLLIDFDYPYWHTENDTPDKCSPEALANVGAVLARIIYNRSLWPEKPSQL
ncbi:M28 family peptidase [bacterium]|nr:M28 family peptidase [bacterium]